MDNIGTQRLERIQDTLCIYNDVAHWDQQAQVVIRSGSYLLEIDEPSGTTHLFSEDDLPVVLLRRMAERVRDDANTIRERDNDIARLQDSLAQTDNPKGLREAKQLVEELVPLLQLDERGLPEFKIQAIKLVRRYTDKRED